MKILLTGFEPFNGRDLNPSQLILEKIQAPEGITLIKELFPVEFQKTSLLIKELMQEHRPDIVLSLGQAGNRPEISVERVAINLDCVRSGNGKKEIADNAGDKPVDKVIAEAGENAYFSTLPVWDMVEAMQDVGVMASVSYSAGTYVCNHVMYSFLHEAAIHYSDTKVGFIHVPFLPEQNPERGYIMELRDMVKSVQAVIDLLSKGN